MHTLSMQPHAEESDARRLAELSKVDFNDVPRNKEGRDEMHEYLALLQSDIQALSRHCMVATLTFGSADGGGGRVIAKVQGECVEQVRQKHPGVDVQPLTEDEYFRVRAFEAFLEAERAEKAGRRAEAPLPPEKKAA